MPEPKYDESLKKDKALDEDVEGHIVRNRNEDGTPFEDFGEDRKALNDDDGPEVEGHIKRT